ncbi:nidogen-2-like [Physella acuta]|uniref:nidogen-2-like n=1 Tax=Physella acuta TaxID=109671 RepID=UPI0027DCB7CE|nr:nidogen-2-like [Physella acuta]
MERMRAYLSKDYKRMLASGFVFLCLCHVICSVQPYGADAGDTALASGEYFNVQSFPNSMPFYGSSYSTFQIYEDGFVTLGDSTIRDVYALKDKVAEFPAVVPWLSLMSSSASSGLGNVYYRLTTEATQLENIATLARRFSQFSDNFLPTYALVVTWDKVGCLYVEDNKHRVNTFQMVLATDGTVTIATFQYLDIQWLYDEPDFTYYLDPDFHDEEPLKLQIGFYKGGGAAGFLLPQSFSWTLWSIVNDTDVGTPGLYAFRPDIHDNINVNIDSNINTSFNRPINNTIININTGINISRPNNNNNNIINTSFN